MKSDEVYAILKKQIQSGGETGGGITPEQIQQAVDAYLNKNPPEMGELKVVGHIIQISSGGSTT